MSLKSSGISLDFTSIAAAYLKDDIDGVRILFTGVGERSHAVEEARRMLEYHQLTEESMKSYTTGDYSDDCEVGGYIVYMTPSEVFQRWGSVYEDKEKREFLEDMARGKTASHQSASGQPPGGPWPGSSITDAS